MSKMDYLDHDGNTLKTFIAVLESASVTKAVEMFGVSQSAVSRTLDKLRSTLDDRLFVRDGCGIRLTAKAQSLRDPTETILSIVKSLTNEREFNPLVESIKFTIAANNFHLGLPFQRP